MRIELFIVVAFFCAGCGGEFAKFPGVFSEPHLVDYRENQDMLEHRYLRKELTYAQYLEEKKKLDDSYAKGERHRQSVVENGPNIGHP